MSNDVTLQNVKHLLTLAGQKGLTLNGFNSLIGTGLLADLFEAAGDGELEKVDRDEFRKRIGLLPLELWITVNYSLSLQEMIAAGCYDWFSGYFISPEHFRLKGTGEKKWKVELIHFNRNMHPEDIVAKLDKMGFRPGAIEELLAFGAMFPSMQLKFPIVALGSVGVIGGRRYGGYLDREGPNRTLNRFDFADELGNICRFLAFR